MITLDAEAGGRTLFDQTFKGTLPLLSTWEEQPETFKEDFRQTARAVALATLVVDHGDPLSPA